MVVILLIIVAIFLIWLFSGNSNGNSKPKTQYTRSPYDIIHDENESEQWRRAIEQTEERRIALVLGVPQTHEQELEEQQKRERALAAKRKWELEKAEHKRRELAMFEQLRKESAQEEQKKKEHAQKEHQRSIAQAENALCESGTEYSHQVWQAFNRNQQAFSLATIQSLSKQANVWDELDNGVAQLDSYDQLLQYIYSFGKMHKAKLYQVFQILQYNHDLMLNGQPIEIIDYGCGQGLGAVGFIDFLKSNPQFKCSIRKVKLIEPSVLALKRAALHVKYSLKSANQPEVIQSINEELDDVLEHQLECDKDTIKFHIFSNILDVEYFDLDELCDKLGNTIHGENYFICVSPNISDVRNFRLHRFMKYFDNAFKTTVISERSSDIVKDNGVGVWKRYEKVFKVIFDEQIYFTNINNNQIPTGYINLTDESDDLPF
jgi:hypothetical protein